MLTSRHYYVIITAPACAAPSSLATGVAKVKFSGLDTLASKTLAFFQAAIERQVRWWRRQRRRWIHRQLLTWGFIISPPPNPALPLQYPLSAEPLTRSDQLAALHEDLVSTIGANVRMCPSFFECW